jgi:hypothetical protein
MDPELELVEQPPLQERLRKQAVAVDDQVLAVLLLELRGFGGDVAGHDGRVGPIGVF